MPVINIQDVLDRISARSGGGDTRPDPQQPLYRAPPEREEYPVDALMDLQAPVEALQYKEGAPVEMVAGAMLSAAALVTQPLYDVDLPAMGRKPTSLYCAAVGASGERKSQVDKLANRPVREQEKQWDENFETDNYLAVNAMDVWELQRRIAKKDFRKNPAALKQALDDLGPKPHAPMPPQLIVEDTSIEMLLMHLEKRPWAGVFSAEAGVLVGNTSWSDDRVLHTAGRLNQLWDGHSPDRHRVTTGVQMLRGRRCSLHLLLHPNLYHKLFSNQVLLDLGTFARWLITWPDSRMGWRPVVVELDPQRQEALDEYYRRIQLLADTLPTINHGALEPGTLKLTDDAKALFVHIMDAHERSLRKDGTYYEIRDFGAKLAEHTGRLAAVLAVYNNPRAPVVDLKAVEAGCVLAMYYADEMKRLRALGAVSQTDRETEQLKRWCLEYTTKKGRDQIHLTEVYQFGPPIVRTATIARDYLTALVAAGWLEELPAGTVIDGASRREAWQIRQD